MIRVKNVNCILQTIHMKMKASPWLFFAAIIFTISTIYWYIRHPDDTVGIVIYAIASILFYVGAIGNWKSGN